MSIFSDLNNLEDISMDREYAALCGISEDELQPYFAESIQLLATANGTNYEETCHLLKRQYDGYHFCENGVGVYNPFSLLNAFKKKKISDYWFKTGTPTFLVKLLQDNHYELKELKGMYVDESTLASVDENHADPIPVFFQSGYLTISDYDSEMGYRLDFPNQEVERGFFDFLLPLYASINKSETKGYLNKLTVAVRQGKPDDLLKTVQTMLSGKPYMLAGGDKEVQATSQGRMDVTIQTKDYVYIIELKLDKSAEEALQQIKDNHYDLPFQADPRKLFLIGVNFSSETRTVEEWRIEEQIK